MKCPEVDCIPGSWHDAWSKYLPTRPGWYWFRDMENDESIHMIHVVIRRGRLQGVFHSSEDIHKVYADWIELWDGEWIEAKLPLLLGERLQVAYDKEAGFDANLINRLNDENKRLLDDNRRIMDENLRLLDKRAKWQIKAERLQELVDDLEMEIKVKGEVDD